MREIKGALPRREAVEDVDHGVRTFGAKRDAFARHRYEEAVTAGLRQCRTGLDEPRAIGVGLDHGGAGSRRYEASQPSPVRGDRRKIDVEDAARARSRFASLTRALGHAFSPA